MYAGIRIRVCARVYIFVCWFAATVLTAIFELATRSLSSRVSHEQKFSPAVSLCSLRSFAARSLLLADTSKKISDAPQRLRMDTNVEVKMPQK